VDLNVDAWFMVEVTFLLGATICYAMAVTFLHLWSNLLQRSFKAIIAMIVVIKVGYYGWACVGAHLYFSEVINAMESEDDHKDSGKALHTTLLVLTIINIVDVLRSVMIVLLCVLTHTICKRRARSAVNNSTEDELSLYSE